MADSMTAEIVSGKKKSAELIHTITYFYNDYLTRLADDLDEWNKKLSVLALQVEQMGKEEGEHSPLAHLIQHIDQYKENFGQAGILVRQASEIIFPNAENRHVGKENEALIREASDAQRSHDEYYRAIDSILHPDEDE